MTTPRTYLFVPGNRSERFDKALASGADAVVLDLEDAVSPEDKARARTLVGKRLIDAQPAERARLVVRINDESTPWFDDDVEMLQGSGALHVMLPKAERVATVLSLRSACPGIAVLALIESARGVLAAEALAAADGVHRLVFGTIDFALDLDLSGDPIGLDHAASRLALASRAAGLAPPVAGVTPEIEDDVRLLADLARARAHGFGAKLCIHPKQVAAVHAALQPSAAELDWARCVVAAAEGAQGAVQLDGRMVDKPVLQRAHILLQRAAR
ncbi:HpcH/HpaI aldolase/citrate lyase family protein [Piscinibacter sp.]|jgi:citrate lyase subunit beta/citryl-CoA lyase|uniref:HpcH/HpaI aldolase/citrate lyase family protein n=1 Tax=Piscinibacter sp. TaxID=1903157 RepID=UPI0035597C46